MISLIGVGTHGGIKNLTLTKKTHLVFHLFYR